VIHPLSPIRPRIGSWKSTVRMDSNFITVSLLIFVAALSACGGGSSGGADPDPGSVSIPDVTNNLEVEALGALDEFRVVVTKSSDYPLIAAGRVISQSSAACIDCAIPGDTVELLISEPHDYQVTMPAHFLVSPLPRLDGGTELQPAVYPDTDNTGSNLTTNEGATLGRVLFYDENLSLEFRNVSCASCHDQKHGFSDPDQLSTGVAGKTRRHSMGLANARFLKSGKAFWDQRAENLEEQALIPIADPIEMGLRLDRLEELLPTLSYYPNLFEAAFGDPAITRDRVGRALAQFVRSMVSIDSRYDQARVDQFARGIESIFVPFDNFTAEENRGKDIFLKSVPEGGGGCFACHTTEAFINTVLGPTNNGLDEFTLDDEGACEPLGGAPDTLCGKFKVPSLRNIAIRPPYMHDGRFDTLEEVIEHYNSEIKPHRNLGDPLVGAAGLPVRLNLDVEDKAALLAFLETLTDDGFLNDPKFSDPFEMAP